MRLKKKISTRVRHYLPSSLTISDSVVIIGSSVAINLLMFGYNAYLGRKLTIADFGLIAFIGSLLNVLYIPLGSFTRTITHQTAFLFGKFNNPNKMIWKGYRSISLLISFALSIAWIAAIPILKKFFSVNDSLPFVLLIPLWLVSIAAAIDAGYLAGIQRFKQLSVIDLIETISLLAVTVLLIETHASSFLYVAITLSTIISFALGWITINRIPSKQISSKRVPSFTFPWNFYQHSLATKLASVAFINIDVILAKHYLTPQAAGEYALLALVGKMIFFVSTLFGQFVVPIVSKHSGSGENPKRVFTKIFGLSLAVVSIGYIVVGLLGSITLPLLFGEKALVITNYLPWYALGMACFGLAHLLLSYYQSIHRYSYTATSILASVLIIVGIMLFHTSVADISTVVGMAGISSLVMVTIMRYWFKIDKQLIHLVLSILISNIHRLRGKKLLIPLPKTAGTYTLSKSFKKPGRYQDYQFGIYTNAKGHKALGKFWCGHTKDAAYYRLQNELVVSQAIERAAKKIGKKLEKRVAVPKIIHMQNAKNSLLILFKWIDADSTTKVKNTSEWIKTFANVRHFFQTISQALLIDKPIGISKRTGIHVLFMYPFALLKASQAYPKQRRLLFRSVLVFVQGIPELLKQKQLTLTHRDVYPANLITHNQKTYVIDHAYSVLTFKSYDQLATIALNWRNRALRKLLLNELQETITTKSDLRLIKALGIYISTLYLMDGNRPDLRAQKYYQSLAYWVYSLRMLATTNKHMSKSNSSRSLFAGTAQ